LQQPSGEIPYRRFYTLAGGGTARPRCGLQPVPLRTGRAAIRGKLKYQVPSDPSNPHNVDSPLRIRMIVLHENMGGASLAASNAPFGRNTGGGSLTRDRPRAGSAGAAVPRSQGPCSPVRVHNIITRGPWVYLSSSRIPRAQRGFSRWNAQSYLPYTPRLSGTVSITRQTPETARIRR